MRKPRSDAKLLQMPEANQARLAEWLLSGMPYYQALEMVQKEFGIMTSLGALANFWKTACMPHLVARRARAVATADEVAQAAAAEPGRFDQATIDALKQRAFELAISPGANPNDVKSLFSLVLKSRDQDLTERRIQLLEQKAAQADATDQVLTDGALTPEQRQQRIAEIYGRA